MREASGLQDANRAAESNWLDRWTEGPTDAAPALLLPGTPAPDLTLPDETGTPRRLADFWADGPALVMFWRHFGCTCGVARSARLIAEVHSYREANLTPVIIAQGEPERTAEYKAARGIPCAILCDPDLDAYRAFGVGHWAVEQVLFDAPPEYWAHPRELGIEFQDGRRREGRPPVDDPWRAAAEFVVGTSGRIRLAYAYQYCEDYPDARVLTTAARLDRGTE
ncbi:MAG: redoxin domain-containing protein [Cryobacterium sp.]|uniref:redoxin domain-containing protein n=1 Tax=unclassified Cryobacterium TaxID=2649013 RepID=UPI0018C95AE6|nr:MULTISPECIES: redoxin domain-containing protein [unclassified Cryobacterium]MCY7405087.1 redoxin domain-containing protein [Cryobacterium sp.]MEC5152681.1 peroxiredoxin [Cryobacterium sp. CAN_C3]